MDNLGKRVFGYFEKAHQEFHYHGVGMAALGAVTHPHLTAALAGADYAGHKLWAAVHPSQGDGTQPKQEAQQSEEQIRAQQQSVLPEPQMQEGKHAQAQAQPERSQQETERQKEKQHEEEANPRFQQETKAEGQRPDQHQEQHQAQRQQIGHFL